MFSFRLFKVFILLLLLAFPVFSQVESTPAGGPWNSPGTWKDGVVPAPGDNVVIKGPVTVDVITHANSVQITNTGSLTPEVINSSTIYKLYVANYIWNDGTINGNNFEIYVGGNIGGSIYNTANGYWRSGTLHVTDTLSHAILSEGKFFGPINIHADSATFVSAGNVQIDSSRVYVYRFKLGNNLQNEKLILDHHTKLHVHYFESVGGDTAGIEMRNGSVIENSPVSGTYPYFTDTYFRGDVRIGADIWLKGNCYLYGTMRPGYYNYYKITSSGLFANFGEVKEISPGSSYKLSFEIYGDLSNNGPWKSNKVRMMGTGNHVVQTDPNYTFSPSDFTADNSTVTVTTTPLTSIASMTGSTSSFLRFDECRVQIMKLVLEPGASLYLLSNSSLAVKELIGNGNTIKFINNSYLNLISSFGIPHIKDVHLEGEVGIGGDQIFTGDCYLNGSMFPNFYNYYTITVHGLFQMDGEIRPIVPGSSYKLAFKFYGDLTVNGDWESSTVRMMGTGDHVVKMDTSYNFSPTNFSADSSTVTAATHLRFDNSRVQIKTLVLKDSSDLKLNGSKFSGHVIGNGNTIYMANQSSLEYVSSFGTSEYENVTFSGDVGIGADQIFSGKCYLKGKMYPQYYNYYGITVNGNFETDGTVQPISTGSSYKIKFNLYGDLTVHGPWNSSRVTVLGNYDHIFKMDTSSTFEVLEFRADSGRVLAGSPLRFDNSEVNIKSLVLQDSYDLVLNNSYFSGEIVGNGNSIYMNQNSGFDYYSYFGLTTINDVSLFGTVNIGANTVFKGNCYLFGTMRPAHYNYYTVSTYDMFQNNGSIEPITAGSSYKLKFEVYGDLENTGTWISSSTILKGDSTQHVGLKDSTFIDVVKIEADRSGGSYQWMLNNNPLSNGGDISGANSWILTITNFDSRFYGTLFCKIDSAGISISSRDIIVNNTITSVEIDQQGPGAKDRDKDRTGIPDHFALSQNFPNPFNPQTTIAYQLPEAGFVTLTLYDMLGRRIKTLISKRQPAGYYDVQFDGNSLASGLYFYVLTVKGRTKYFTSTKKMLLLK